MVHTRQSSIHIAKFTYKDPVNVPKSSVDLKDVSMGFLCGCLGGVSNILSSHPLDTIKVRMQILDMKLVNCFKFMTANEGVLSLYKGISSPLFNVPLIYAVFFGAYETGKWLQGISPLDKLSTHQSMIAGACAGFAVCGIMTPVELIKCRLQMEGTGRKVQTDTAFGMAKQIYRTSGIRGLYKGNLITILREIPAGAVYFGSYEYAKKNLRSMYGDSQLIPLVAGGIAGLLSWVVSYPQDIVKTKLQCDDGITRLYPQHKYLRDGGIVSCAKNVWNQGGFRGFFKGFSACSIKAVVAEGVTFFVYENTRKHLKH